MGKIFLIVFAGLAAMGLLLNMASGPGHESKQEDEARIAALRAQMPASQRADMDRRKAEAEKKKVDAELKKIKDDAQLQQAFVLAKTVKSNLHDPSSFELVQLLGMEDGTVCIAFRGRNGFNALRTDQLAYSAKGVKQDWNRKCAGKNGTDLSRVASLM